MSPLGVSSTGQLLTALDPNTGAYTLMWPVQPPTNCFCPDAVTNIPDCCCLQPDDPAACGGTSACVTPCADADPIDPPIIPPAGCNCSNGCLDPSCGGKSVINTNCSKSLTTTILGQNCTEVRSGAGRVVVTSTVGTPMGSGSGTLCFPQFNSSGHFTGFTTCTTAGGVISVGILTVVWDQPGGNCNTPMQISVGVDQAVGSDCFMGQDTLGNPPSSSGSQQCFGCNRCTTPCTLNAMI